MAAQGGSDVRALFTGPWWHQRGRERDKGKHMGLRMCRWGPRWSSKARPDPGLGGGVRRWPLTAEGRGRGGMCLPSGQHAPHAAPALTRPAPPFPLPAAEPAAHRRAHPAAPLIPSQTLARGRGLPAFALLWDPGPAETLAPRGLAAGSLNGATIDLPVEAAASPAPPVPVRGPWGPHPVSLGLHFHMCEMEQSRAFCESRVRGRVDGLAERGPGREGVRRLGPLSPASSAYLGLGDLSCLRTRRQRKATQRAPPGGGRPDELEPATPGLRHWLQVFLRRVSHSRTACGLTTVQAASPTHAGAAETHGPESRGLGRGTCLAGCGPEPPAPHSLGPHTSAIGWDGLAGRLLPQLHEHRDSCPRALHGFVNSPPGTGISLWAVVLH